MSFTVSLNLPKQLSKNGHDEAPLLGHADQDRIGQ
jgi:hypothetical protein